MPQPDRIEAILSDGSKYIFYSNNLQQIMKDITVNEVNFTICRLHKKCLDNPKVKHIYTITAGANYEEYACVTLDSELEKVASAIAGDIEYGDIEYIVQNVPHDTILREESPKITFGMFVDAVVSSDIFDFDHPEIVKILGSISAE